jgi:CheY-like chemotaxis protein
MTILIVDDDPDIRRLLTTFLTFKGYHPVSVANGREALTHLQCSYPGPHLILLDQMMPVMDGATFRHAQQQDPQLATIPVVVMSAVENLQAQRRRLSAEGYLPKPIDFDTLLTLVEQYCCQSHQLER